MVVNERLMGEGCVIEGEGVVVVEFVVGWRRG